jgi:hypothetical protein
MKQLFLFLFSILVVNQAFADTFFDRAVLSFKGAEPLSFYPGTLSLSGTCVTHYDPNKLSQSSGSPVFNVIHDPVLGDVLTVNSQKVVRFASGDYGYHAKIEPGAEDLNINYVFRISRNRDYVMEYRTSSSEFGMAYYRFCWFNIVK